MLVHQSSPRIGYVPVRETYAFGSFFAPVTVRVPAGVVAGSENVKRKHYTLLTTLDISYRPVSPLYRSSHYTLL